MLGYTSSAFSHSIQNYSIQRSADKHSTQQSPETVGAFPSHYYPKPFALSPRQAEVLGRHDPRRETTVPIVVTPGSTPRSSIVPRFPSEAREQTQYSPPVNPYAQEVQEPQHRSYNLHNSSPEEQSKIPDPPVRNHHTPVVSSEAPMNDHGIPMENHTPWSNFDKIEEVAEPVSPRNEANDHRHPSGNHVPANYRHMIAAPVAPRTYGSYPELTNRADPNSLGHLVNRPLYFYEEPEQSVNNQFEEVQPNATMETKVTGQGQPKRVGRWTLAQLRQTDGIIPSQAGWNKGDSQKLTTNFGTPRNTQLNVKSECLQEIPGEIAQRTHGEVRLQSGTNKFASQRGMTNFGSGRDVCREGRYVNTNPADLPELSEEKIRMSEGIVRLQAGTNKYDSQKGMTNFGTGRRETTKMIDSKHPEYDHEKPDQSQIPLQSGTNKFASQKGMMNFGTARRETTKMVDSAHPEYSHEASIDQTTIPLQMGSNKHASQKLMTGFGQPRWEVLDPSISWQNRKSQGMVRLQSGTNRFASQQGMTGFGTCRNTTFEAEGGELPYEAMKVSETIIPSQAGWNKGDSQKGYTSFGASRDVKGKHLKRIWELEYPEEAEISLDRL